MQKKITGGLKRILEKRQCSSCEISVQESHILIVNGVLKGFCRGCYKIKKLDRGNYG